MRLPVFFTRFIVYSKLPSLNAFLLGEAALCHSLKEVG